MSIEIKNHKVITDLKKAKISDSQIKTAINTAEKLLNSLNNQEKLISENQTISEIFNKYLKEN